MIEPLNRDIVSGLHRLEGYLGLSHFRGEALTSEEYQDGYAAIEAVRGELDRLRTPASTQPSPFREEWGILDSEEDGITFDSEAEARAGYAKYPNPYEGIYRRYITDWEPDPGTSEPPLVATWDSEVRAGYVYFQAPGTPVAHTETDIEMTANIDYDHQGDIVGIELLL